MDEGRLLEPRAWPDVAAYVDGLDGLDGARTPLWSRIHPADEMYRYERSIPYRSKEAAAIGYFATGRQLFRSVREIVEWRFGGFDAVRSFLDFASGYGRFTRFLVRAMPPQRITIAEIDPSAVLFQERVFGVHGVVSSADPDSFRLEPSFDVVFAASFFSHLPERSFGRWLGRLRAGLSPGGVLIFSVHGMGLLAAEAADASSGIVFRAVSETDRLEGAEYGTSYVTPEFVRAAAARAAGGEDRLLVFPLGLGGLQDLYVLLRPPLPAGELRLSRCPLGTSDRSGIEGGIVTVEGWVEGDQDERPPDVRLFLRETVAGHLPGDGAAGRGSRRRWAFSFPLASVEPDDVVRVEAESARGLTSLLAIGSMRPYLPAAPL